MASRGAVIEEAVPCSDVVVVVVVVVVVAAAAAVVTFSVVGGASDKFHGWGRRWTPDGGVLDGYFVYGVQMGVGRQRLPQLPNGFATYRGDIRSGVWAGRGRLEHNDGTIYEGSFAAGKK